MHEMIEMNDTGNSNKASFYRSHSSARREEAAPPPRQPSQPSSSSTSSSAPTKQIDDLLNEFKSKQETSHSGYSSDAYAAADDDIDVRGGFDPIDANSTNIFISYLAPTVTGKP
jgi:hypothetical protein